MRVVKTALSMDPITWEQLDEFAHIQHLSRSAAAEVLLRIALGLVET